LHPTPCRTVQYTVYSTYCTLHHAALCSIQYILHPTPCRTVQYTVYSTYCILHHAALCSIQYTVHIASYTMPHCAVYSTQYILLYALIATLYRQPFRYSHIITQRARRIIVLLLIVKSRIIEGETRKLMGMKIRSKSKQILWYTCMLSGSVCCVRCTWFYLLDVAGRGVIRSVVRVHPVANHRTPHQTAVQSPRQVRNVMRSRHTNTDTITKTNRQGT